MAGNGIKLRKKVLVNRPLGLHIRPATEIAKEANKFTSKVRIKVNGKTADATSVLDIMTLGATKDTMVELQAVGPDAGEALQRLLPLL